MKIVSAEEYAKLTGLGVEEVKRKFNLGLLPGHKTAGGRYKIEYYDNDNKQVEDLIRENEKLKNTIKNMQMMASSALQLN